MNIPSLRKHRQPLKYIEDLHVTSLHLHQLHLYNVCSLKQSSLQLRTLSSNAELAEAR